MTKQSLIDLPTEIIYSIFQYLHKEHVIYSFFELTNDFSFIVEYFLRRKFQLIKTNDNTIFQYCLYKIIPIIGFNLSHLSIGHPYRLSTYIQSIKTYCPYLKVLNIHCYSKEDDIRLYIAEFLHYQLISLILIFNNQIIGEHISHRLLNKSGEEQFQKFSIPSSSLVLNLSSMNDLSLLKQYSQSSYLPDGFYMIECLSTEGWLIDSKDDLCVMSNKLLRESIFLIKQSFLEYEFFTQHTRCPWTVLKCYESEEHWIPSSILSTRRKQSNQLCKRFTLEKIDNYNLFYIRPCYSRAKRLQVLGKRIVVSLGENDKTVNHRFKFHRVA
ncbi:hypothetical protein I4U23_017680 [Adineta vaga]|nr:hypothetical protein I4U23_017680 [Adineta vaga]